MNETIRKKIDCLLRRATLAIAPMLAATRAPMPRTRRNWPIRIVGAVCLVALASESLAAGKDSHEEILTEWAASKGWIADPVTFTRIGMGFRSDEKGTMIIGIVHDRATWFEQAKPYQRAESGELSSHRITLERLTVAGHPTIRTYNYNSEKDIRAKAFYEDEGWEYYCHDYRVLIRSGRSTRSNDTGSDPKGLLEDFLAFAKAKLAPGAVVEKPQPGIVEKPPAVVEPPPIHPPTPIVKKYGMSGEEYVVPAPLLGRPALGVITQILLKGDNPTIVRKKTGQLLRNGDFVFLDDIITANHCMVKLVMLSPKQDGSAALVVIKRNTCIQLLGAPEKPEGFIDCFLHYGKLLFSGSAKFDRQGHRIQTSNAAVGCEGTEFEAAYDPLTGKTVVSVFEGIVSLTCRTNNARSQKVKAGFTASMGKDCSIALTETDSALNTASKAGWAVSADSGAALHPIADSHVYAYDYSGWSKANWGAYDRLGAGWHPTGGEKRAYLRFDLAGVDPARVKTATLRLFHYQTGGGHALGLGVYRVTGPWVEGRGTYKPSTPAGPGEISWVHQPSVDSSSAAQFHPGPGVDKWIEVDVTPLVRAWLSGTPNHGLMIKAQGALANDTPHAEYGFYSREADAEKRPLLVLSDGIAAPPATGAPPNIDQAVAQLCASDEDFVRSLYHCITHREPTAQEVREQVGLLQNGTPRQHMIAYFFASPGYVNQNHDGGRFMTDACQAIYARQPTAANLKAWPHTHRNTIVLEMFKHPDHLAAIGACPTLWPKIPDWTPALGDPAPQAVERAATTSVAGRADPNAEAASAPLAAETTQAYEEYMEAYNAMTRLMAAGQGDSPEGKAAYQKFSLAKEKYEDFLKHGGPGAEDLTAGEPGIGTLGRERNRFQARGAPGNLEILSSYWKGGTAEWSTPVTFNGGSIGPVDHHVLYTGAQADGYNTGFLAYAPRGKNRLEFKVFHFSWADAEGRKPHGTVHYSGQMDLHNKTLMPVSLRFTRQALRLCEIEWRTTDGSSCRASLSMYKKDGTVLHEGYKDLGCDEGVYEPVVSSSATNAEPGTVPDTVATETGDWDVSRVTLKTSEKGLMWDSGNFRSISWRRPISMENVVIEFDGWCAVNGLGVYWLNDEKLGYFMTLGGWFNARSCSDGRFRGIGTPVEQREYVEGAHIQLGRWQRYKIVRSGDWLDYYVDGVRIIHRQIPSRYDGKGTLHFSSWGSAIGVDNLTINQADTTPGDSGGTTVAGDESNKVTGDESNADGGIGGGTGGAEDPDEGPDDGPTGADGLNGAGDTGDAGGGAGLPGTDTGGTQTEPGETFTVSGLYSDENGNHWLITRDEKKLTLKALENKGPVGWKTVYGQAAGGERISAIFGARVEFGDVSQDGARIQWTWGGIWSRFNASPTAADIEAHSFQQPQLAGLWVSEGGHHIRVTQNDGQLTLAALENKGPIGWKTANATLNYWTVSFIIGSRVVSGKVSDDGTRIDWGPGFFWTRSVTTSSGDVPDAAATNKSAPPKPKPKLEIIGFGIKKQ